MGLILVSEHINENPCKADRKLHGRPGSAAAGGECHAATAATAATVADRTGSGRERSGYATTVTTWGPRLIAFSW